MMNEDIEESWLARRVFPLNEKWKFREASDSAWLQVAQFPTNVHLDLLHHGKIPDPFFEQNETAVQWVGEKVWIYCTEFDGPRSVGAAKQQIALVLEGLDTFATVILNGIEILRSNNMFIPKRVDVSNVINVDGNNNLEIRFDSTWLIGEKLQEHYPDHFWGCWNGESSRLAVRKAQYHYGWDWGPTLLTAGPWRPVYLEQYSARLDDLSFAVEVADSLQAAKIVAKADCEGVCTSVVFELCLGEVLVERRTAEVIDTHAEITFMLVKPQLWYPATYGEQPLYHLKATLLLGGKRLDTISKRLGVRKAVVVQRELKDAPGTSFFFEINNIPIFCGGSNWIPADNFIPRISRDRYRSWLQLIRDGNQIMIRVWGGGIFEEQALYDAADELGILIWQDFMFACGNYPAMISEFRETVREEARSNVKRLRHHPSIVLYAGNNEDYQFQESDNPDYNPDDPPESWLKSSFPARYIYERILVDVMKELAPGTYYHLGSPYGGKETKDPTVGDIHQWNIWHGKQMRYQNFDRLSGRFISEFGMQSFPDIRTIDSFLPRDTTDRYPQSSTVDFHNKAAGHERRLALYLVENLKCTFEPIEQYIYLTQLMQAECLSTAYRVWRRNWKGPGREYTAGVLVWQINDCWPTISWAIVDYYLRPKLAYYAIKQCLAPVTVAAKCVVHESPQNPYTRVDINRESRVYVWASNLLLTPLHSKLQIKAFDVITGEQIYQRTGDTVVLQENRSTELTDFRLPTTTKIGQDTNRVVVAVYLLDLTGKQIARFILWPEILKYVKVQKPKHLRVEFTGDCVSVSAEVPVKGLTFEVDGAVFEDNLIDLVPGETVSVKVKGLDRQRGSKMAVRYYEM